MTVKISVEKCDKGHFFVTNVNRRTSRIIYANQQLALFGILSITEAEEAKLKAGGVVEREVEWLEFEAALKIRYR